MYQDPKYPFVEENRSICFSCRHAVINAPINHSRPGYCNWKGSIPSWLQFYVDRDSNDYYTPKRDIYSSSFHAVTECSTYGKRSS